MERTQGSELSADDSRHIIPVSTYLWIFAGLMGLLVLTVAAALEDFSVRLNWGPANVVIAMSIAIAKAVLVILYFMHVKYSSGLTKFFIFIILLFLCIMFFFTFGDYMTRNWIPQVSALNITGR